MVFFQWHRTSATHTRTEKNLQDLIIMSSQRTNCISTKSKAQQIITRILQEWRTRKHDRDAKILQEAAGNNSMPPLWKYQKSLQKEGKNNKQYTLPKTDDGHTRTPRERVMRRGEWIQQQFHVPP